MAVAARLTCAKAANLRCNQRTGSPMARLRTATLIVSLGLKIRTEGMGIRATVRVIEKSHATIINWERRVAVKESAWTPPAPANGDITVEGDELYTRGARKPSPPEDSCGWTINFLERHSRYWIVVKAGKKDALKLIAGYL